MWNCETILQGRLIGAKLPEHTIDGKDILPLTGQTDNGDLTAKYSAKLNGDLLIGTIEYDLGGNTGELDVTGNRSVSVH